MSFFFESNGSSILYSVFTSAGTLEFLCVPNETSVTVLILGTSLLLLLLEGAGF